MGNCRTYNLDSEFTFGQYIGEFLEDIIDYDIGYVTYLIDEQVIELENEAYKYYQKQLK